MQKFSKKHIVETLKQSLESHPAIRAAWLGGSSATGFEDELSDTDIVAVCEEPDIVFVQIEKALATISAVEHAWKVEQSPWKDFSQKFYILQEGPEVYYIDAGVFKSLNPEDYREYFNLERHGQPVVLFDKDNILKEASLSPRYESSSQIDWGNRVAHFEVMYRTFLKEARRGKYIDSFLFYQRLVSIWVQLKRQLQTPQKHDFGLRYIYRDFTEPEAQQIEKLLRQTDLETLKTQALEIRGHVFELKKQQTTQVLTQS